MAWDDWKRQKAVKVRRERQAETDQRVIGPILKLRDEGLSLRKIAEKLTEEQIPPPASGTNPWSHKAVRRILDRCANGSNG